MGEIKNLSIDNIKIAVIGLGYVGLPLAIEFAKKFPTIGFDIDKKRIKKLKEGLDSTQEISKESLNGTKLIFTSQVNRLEDCNFFIITVPTPVDSSKIPDLIPIKSATALVSSILKKGDIVVYESTVFPGLTEEICVPILETSSNLKYNEDFFCGYSPERINPGDKSHRIVDIVKITSGSTPEVATLIDEIYKKIITAGTYLAKDIKTAEAAKVIENTQRDVNIALINELSIIFDTLDIDTKEVLEAAQTKWNFLPFKPGLVGGHCIGVDPYYLTYKSLKSGYKPEMILSGRKINDNMPFFVSSKLQKYMEEKKIDFSKANILILGFTFKENCPDYRNTKVIDLYRDINAKVQSVKVFDPWPDPKKIKEEFGLELLERLEEDRYDAVIHAVDHDLFSEIYETGIEKFCREEHIIFDLKHSLSDSTINIRL